MDQPGTVNKKIKNFFIVAKKKKKSPKHSLFCLKA